MGFFVGMVSDKVMLAVVAVLTVDVEQLFCLGVLVGVSERPILDRRQRVFRAGQRE